MSAFSPDLPLTVAYSGGADSSALLLACARRWPGQVAAVHVNHGLQSAAADFQSHCQSVCAALGVPLFTETVDAHATPGQSPEDAARRARYGALARFAKSEYGALGAPRCCWPSTPTTRWKRCFWRSAGVPV